MPRIYDHRNLAWDYCQDHFPDEAEAEEFFDATSPSYAYDAEHPPYGEGWQYRCCVCSQYLGPRDA